MSYGENSDEAHVVDADGFYRILFTPDKIQSGDVYKFDADGRYGTGEEFTYNIFIEDAPQYYVSFKDGTPVGLSGEETYFALNRIEQNIATAEYESPAFFIGERDFSVKYCIWELANGSYRLIDDDNNEDTAFFQNNGNRRRLVYHTLCGRRRHLRNHAALG